MAGESGPFFLDTAYALARLNARDLWHAAATAWEARVVATGTSLVTDDCPVPRFTYDRGTLEILANLPMEHERVNRTLASLVEHVALEQELDLHNFGSMTFTRKDIGYPGGVAVRAGPHGYP